MTPVVGVELTATLTDPDGSVTGETWMWYKSMDETFMDGIEMEIGDATSAYTPMAADEDYYLMVKVMYTDGHGSGKEQMATTTGMVTTVPDQEGTVRLSSMTPVVDVELTATLTDPDGSITGATWMWSKSMDGNEMTITAGVTSEGAMSSYTPVAADEGYYLMVKVMYTDGHGSGKEQMATTGMVVSNSAPVFTTETTTRMVEENTAAGMNIGAHRHGHGRRRRHADLHPGRRRHGQLRHRRGHGPTDDEGHAGLRDAARAGHVR